MDRIICVSYPRAGSRFLRNLIMESYPEDFIYYESYERKCFPKKRNFTPQDANLIKTHDFDLIGKTVLSDLYPSDRKYLVQIRQPLDAIISWYELDLKKNNSIDSELAWLSFLEEKIIFWKKFYDLWVRNLANDNMLVVYDDLFNYTSEILHNVFKFLNVKQHLDIDTLEQVINKIPFSQYNNLKSIKDKKRDIKEFKYYDANKFNFIISDLEKAYPIQSIFK